MLELLVGKPSLSGPRYGAMVEDYGYVGGMEEVCGRGLIIGGDITERREIGV